VPGKAPRPLAFTTKALQGPAEFNKCSAVAAMFYPNPPRRCNSIKRGRPSSNLDRVNRACVRRLEHQAVQP